MATVGLSTNGIKMAYAPETTAGTKPTTGWEVIPDIVSIPAIGAEPGTIDVTPLSEMDYQRSVKGLRTVGAITITGNMTSAFMTAWDTLMEAYVTAQKGDKTIWYSVYHPDFDQAFYFDGEPTEIPFPAASSNTAWQPAPSIIVGTVHDWDAKPTIE